MQSSQSRFGGQNASQKAAGNCSRRHWQQVEPRRGPQGSKGGGGRGGQRAGSEPQQRQQEGAGGRLGSHCAGGSAAAGLTLPMTAPACQQRGQQRRAAEWGERHGGEGEEGARRGRLSGLGGGARSRESAAARTRGGSRGRAVRCARFCWHAGEKLAIAHCWLRRPCGGREPRCVAQASAERSARALLLLAALASGVRRRQLACPTPGPPCGPWAGTFLMCTSSRKCRWPGPSLGPRSSRSGCPRFTPRGSMAPRQRRSCCCCCTVAC